MRRRGVPCGCTDNGRNGGCCGLKEKLAILWDMTIGSILRINGVSPDGDGDFAIEAGDNINITETGTGNGLRIDTTGGVSYYDSGDAYVNVDNNDLEITVNAGVTGGLALQDDLDTVTGAVNSILDGTTVVPEATHATSADSATSATNATNATYLGSDQSNVGSDTNPIKIVNGQAVAVTNALQKTKITNSYHESNTYTGGVNHLIGNAVIQPAGSTIIIMHRMFTQNITGITAGFRISGNNQFWVTTGNNTGGDFRMESILVSTATVDRTIQAEIFLGQNAVIESDVEMIIIP